ncbi:uncharacterized protein BJX67DRAFT_373926 [Aspergillus lucknowensis]|uniref:NmrA-like domain-containing protein n=1 Tax=Aspergillus lucknowensis TaxID=176173 RepID=A0ABR4LIQ1_9EURO
MSRKVCITSAASHTGALIARLLLTENTFKKGIASVSCLTLYPDSDPCNDLSKLGAKIVPHKPGRLRHVVASLKEIGADTLCILPPGREDAFDVTAELIEAAKKAGIPNVCFISSTGCDMAERERQPLLRSLVDLETMFLSSKGEPETAMGRSLVVIRRGFYAENLLLYSHQAQEEGLLPLPIGPNHKFAPMALSDVALVAAHVLTGHGKHGFSDKHRGQLMVLTGPSLTTGDELAGAASKALGEDLKFEDISEAEARTVLRDEAGTSEGEIKYLLEYYSLVREGKTNYISTTAFHDVTGKHPQEPVDFFKHYAQEMHPKRAAHKRRKLSSDK